MELNKIYNEDNIETMARMPDGYIDLTVGRDRMVKKFYHSATIDDLLLQEVFSLRQKVLILAEILAKYEPELSISGLLHDLGTEDFGAKNTEQTKE